MVLIFQLAVVITIGSAWLVYGKRASLYVTIAWSIWTLAAVHASGLVILQGAVAWVTYLLLPADDTREREHLIRNLKLMAILGVIACLSFGVWMLIEKGATWPFVGETRHAESAPQFRRNAAGQNCRQAGEWDERRWHGVPVEELGPRPPCSEERWNDED
jgi:hypothetical protein